MLSEQSVEFLKSFEAYENLLAIFGTFANKLENTEVNMEEEKNLSERLHEFKLKNQWFFPSLTNGNHVIMNEAIEDLLSSIINRMKPKK